MVATSKNALGVAVIGAGYWGINHVTAYQRAADANLVAVSDVDENRLKQPALQGIQTALSHQEFLADRKIAAVSIVTPNPTHFPIAEDCLGTGKHVLVEKPMALSLREAKAMHALSSRNDLILCVGYQYLFHPLVHEVRSVLSSGKGFSRMEFEWTAPTGPQNEDLLLDLGVHPLSILDFLFPKKEIRLDSVATSPSGRTLSLGGSISRTDLSIVLSWEAPVKKRVIRLVGPQGSRVFDCTPPPPEPLPLDVEVAHFLSCVLARTPSAIIGSERGVRVAKTVEGIKRICPSEAMSVEKML